MNYLKQIYQSLFKPAITDNKDYLEILVRNLEEVQKSEKSIPFTIQELRPKGFIIKTGGLFGFVWFNFMPWHYHNMACWQYVAPFLIGQKFHCSIFSLKTKPIQIIVNGKAHQFASITLEIGACYQAIIVQKASYGVFVEIGYHFNWKYGSIVGLVHKSTFLDQDDYENAEAGHTMNTYFRGYDTDNRIIFGESVMNIDFLTGAVAHYIGTVREVMIKRISAKQRDFLIEDKYPATFKGSNKVSIKEKQRIKKAIINFEDNEIIKCLVVGINLRKKRFQVELPEAYYRKEKE